MVETQVVVTDNQKNPFEVRIVYVLFPVEKPNGEFVEVPIILNWNEINGTNAMQQGGGDILEINRDIHMAHRPVHLHDLGRPNPTEDWNARWNAPNDGFGDNPMTRVDLPAGAMLYRWDQGHLIVCITTQSTKADIGIVGKVHNFVGTDVNAVHGGGMQIVLRKPIRLTSRRATHIEHFLRVNDV